MQSHNADSLNQKVLVEQVKIQYRALIPLVAVSLVVSFALVYGLWDVAPQTTLITWLGLMAILLFARVLAYLNFQKNFAPEKVQRYTLYFVIGAGASGLLWGIGGVVLFPDGELEYQLFILFVLIGMGAGAVSSLTTYLPAFFSFFPISLIPITIQLIVVGEPLQLSMGIMTAAYIIGLSYFAININRALEQSLRLRFENIDLVEQLRQQKDEAEHANLSKTRFLAAASHDLRQPLYALTLFTSVLDDFITQPKTRRVVDQIKSSVDALQTLFNALLDISRLEAGVLKVEESDFALQPLFEKLANDFNPQASEKGLSMHWPDCAYAVHSDQTLLEQVLRNLVGNAIRYTDSGEIRITCEEEGGRLTINVIDTGVGIPEDERDAIFEEFHQLSNPERDRSKGLGLGLAIVQRTAKLLGHPFQVESQLGKGSTFSIIVKQATIVESPAETESLADNSVSHSNAVSMVVIDDDDSIREGMESLLHTWGCDVISVASKDEAMAKLAQHDRTPSGIIADYRLRENQTGIDAIHAIHEKYGAAIPALIVTGDTAAELLREVRASGFQVLHKPVAPVKLRTFLRNAQLRKKKSSVNSPD